MAFRIYSVFWFWTTFLIYLIQISLSFFKFHRINFVLIYPEFQVILILQNYTFLIYNLIVAVLLSHNNMILFVLNPVIGNSQLLKLKRIL
jgi:hypothetical protein